MSPEFGEITVHSDTPGIYASYYSYNTYNGILSLYYGPDDHPDYYRIEDIGNDEYWLCCLEAGIDGEVHSEYRIKIRRITNRKSSGR